jgi:ATP-dependent Clp protease adaptor protein ClpS
VLAARRFGSSFHLPLNCDRIHIKQGELPTLLTSGFLLMAASLGLVLYPSVVTTYNGTTGVEKVRKGQRIIPAGGCTVGASIGPGRQGGGVLDRPTIEKATPGRESEFDLKKSRKLSPPYRVMLHNDSYNKREYVVQVLMKVIPGMSVDNAVNIMNEAHMNGLAVVIICGQNDAEEHCLQLRNNGLLSSIEPASGSC